MRFEYQILAALLLDLVIGDPRWFPHPVKFIAQLAISLESMTRRLIPNARAAGIATALLVILITGGTTGILILCASRLHPVLGGAMSVLLLYTTFAARDLADHSTEVYKALERSDLPYARFKASWMVGRDTENLDESGVVRAAVESVAENTVDGVTAPIFFAVLGGPVGAMVYKAINTLDSTFGYKNERYINFGWASARIDDFANFLPARLTAPIIVIAAAVLRLYPINAIRICLRDHGKHVSPNSGIPEAAFAGALGVQLGGLLHRKGESVEMPRLGEPIEALEPKHIPLANMLMMITSFLSAGAFLGIRSTVIYLWRCLI
ncbi:MAG: adenosylcobinamide-phosphate synthase CbiB [Armatimonadota bacterium]